MVISGPSGSGKTTIIHRILHGHDIDFSVSATTRLARPDETHGVDYWFLTVEEFLSLRDAGELLEWAEYNGRFYGTPTRPIEEAIEAGRDILLDIELVGARQVREQRPEALMIFIAAPSLADLEARLRGRGDTSEEDIRGRLAIAAGQIVEAKELFDHVVINRDLDEATEEVANLIIGSR
ncbi:MAG: guanylate kinase [Actinomycetota bacterium]|nr:guanylate kinase [Actinomycetota bacterium]